MSTARIRVAIVGGGIAGLTLAKALQLQKNDVVFDVFEGKSAFSERGASVGLAPNATNVLRAAGFDVDRMLSETQAASSSKTEAIAAIGAHRGEKLWDIDVGAYSVVRTKWLEQLLHGLPAERLHNDKKVVEIDHLDHPDVPCTLKFADGSTHEADVVVGCDGIHSKVREVILGSENRSALDPVFAGYWDARTVLPLDKAIAGFGKGLFDSTSTNMHRMLIGKGSYMLLIPHEISKSYFVVAAGAAGPGFDSGTWKTELTRDFLENAFDGWDEGIRTTVIDSLLAPDAGPGSLFSEFESAPTPTYHRGHVCMLGDAAHSILPWIGQGAALSMEDACTLAAILGAVQSRSEITSALAAFDHVCKVRPSFVVDCSRNAAKLSVGGFGLDPASIAALGNPTGWWTDVCKLDMNKHLKEAVEHFHSIKAK